MGLTQIPVCTARVGRQGYVTRQEQPVRWLAFTPRPLATIMALAAMALKFWLPILIPPLRSFLTHNFFAENYGVPAHRGFRESRPWQQIAVKS